MTTATPSDPSGNSGFGGRAWRPMRRSAAALLITTALTGLAAAGGARWSENHVRGALAGMGATAGTVSADPLSGRVRLTDVVATADGFRVHAGTISLQGGLALIPAAVAADPLVVSDVTADVAGVTVRMPRIEVTGGTVSEQDVRGLFAKDGGTKLADRLARLSAARIGIPSVTVEDKHAGETDTVTYRDVALTDVKSGVVASAISSGGTVDAGPPSQRVKGTFGAVTIQGADLPAVARFYTETSSDRSVALATAYASFALDGMQLTTNDDVKVAIQKLTGSDIKLRPLPRPFREIVGQMRVSTEPGKPADTSAYKAALADLFQSLAIGSLEVVETTVDDPGERSGAAAPTPTKGRIGRITFAGTAAAYSLKVADAELTPPDGRVGLRALSYEGSLLDARGGPTGAAQPSPASAISLVGTVKVEDVTADLPNDHLPGERMRFGLKSWTLGVSQPVDGVPVAWKTAVDHVTFTLPPAVEEDAVKMLLAMGYKDLDLSGAADVSWQPATQELKIDNLMLSGGGMATVKLSGVLGNVNKDILSGDEALVQVALAGATVKTVSLSLADQGLANRLAARQADQDGKTPEDIRKTYGSAAAIMIPGFLGGSAQARTLGNAVARFIAKPGRLDISATAKDPQGLGAADFMAVSGNPANLIEQLDIKATAH